MQSVILVAMALSASTRLLEGGKNRKQASGLHRGLQGTAAQQVQHTFEIVGEHVQAHLGTHPVERSCEEVGGAHPGFQRAERVLDRLTADPHHLGRLIQATLHRLEHCLMLPAAHSAL